MADDAPSQCKAPKVARMILAANGYADYVDAVALKETKAAVAAARPRRKISAEMQELLAAGDDPNTADTPQNGR
ncbi:hypothetical protein [Streptomyces althioticus]|uniref:hypothetical protein n=1 Tax=Streptomyces althioticus TaxID=83380 RepID=UPI0018746786